VPLARLALGRVLGEGASGVVHAASMSADESTGAAGAISGAISGASAGAGASLSPPTQFAVKVFKPSSSDGRPEDEVEAALALPRHANLIDSLFFFDEPARAGAPRALGLVMEFVEGRLLGRTPSFESVTRDTFVPGADAFALRTALAVARGVARALAHMHAHGVVHGDVYAHNTLVAGAAGAEVAEGVKLGDLGAAYFAPPALLPRLAALEARGFACLLDDMLTRCAEGRTGEGGVGDAAARARAELEAVQAACEDADVASRPTMAAVAARLDSIAL
jgi:serine/threonine protein kinase